MREYLKIFLLLNLVAVAALVSIVFLVLFLTWDLEIVEILKGDLQNFTWMKFRIIMVSIAGMALLVKAVKDV